MRSPLASYALPPHGYALVTRRLLLRHLASRWSDTDELLKAGRGQGGVFERASPGQEQLEAEFLLTTRAVHTRAGDAGCDDSIEIHAFDFARNSLRIEGPLATLEKAAAHLLPKRIDDEQQGVARLRLRQGPDGVVVHRLGYDGEIGFLGTSVEGVRAAERDIYGKSWGPAWIHPDHLATGERTDPQRGLTNGRASAGSAALRRLGILAHYGVYRATTWSVINHPSMIGLEVSCDASETSIEDVVAALTLEDWEPKASLIELQGMEPPAHYPISVGEGVIDFRIIYDHGYPSSLA